MSSVTSLPVSGSSHSRLGSNLSREFMMVAFMADMLVPKYFTVHFDLISEIVRLIVNSWVVGILL